MSCLWSLYAPATSSLRSPPALPCPQEGKGPTLGAALLHKRLGPTWGLPRIKLAKIRA